MSIKREMNEVHTAKLCEVHPAVHLWRNIKNLGNVNWTACYRFSHFETVRHADKAFR
jgi:hypothetical protein